MNWERFSRNFVKACYHTGDLILACSVGGILGYFGALHFQHNSGDTFWAFTQMLLLAVVFILIYSLVRVYALEKAESKK